MKTFISGIFITAGCIVLLLFAIPVSAAQSTDPATFEDFELEEYLAIISAIAETEEFPHYLAENEQRYEAYRAKNPNMPFDLVIAHVNVNIDIAFGSDVQPVHAPEKITVLVNRNFAMPSGWEPDDLIDLGGGHVMREEAAEQFSLMRAAMRESNLNLSIVMTYRSYARQRSLYNSAVAERGVQLTAGGVARPGHSEHQTGLAIDVLHRGHDGGLMINQGFDGSAQYRWLVNNAHNYGFILRYPNGYRNFSGFIFEPWHWRFVGVPVATAMHDMDIKLFDEFYGRYLVQGVVDKVNLYILEQQAIAEAAERAAAEAAAAEAAALAEAEATAEAAAIAAEAAAIEAAKREAAEAIATAAAETIEIAITKTVYTITNEFEVRNANRHFIEAVALVGILAVVIGIPYLKKKKNVR